MGTDTTGPIPVYLQTLADNLSDKMDLPENMSIKISVINSDFVNAFATLDGNVVFFTGLLDAVPDENTLAMVMAHEIAHVKLRHPLRSLGRWAVVGIAIATISGVASNDVVAGLFGDTELLTALSFSRDQESAADKLAVEALVKYYGHAGGAVNLFKVFNKLHDQPNSKISEFFTTHPLNKNRTGAVKKQAQKYGWPLNGKTNDLPKPIIIETKRLLDEMKNSEKNIQLP